MQLLAKDAGLDANLLLNIGPMPNGMVQPEFVKVLDSVGQWMTRNGESIYGTRGTGLGLQPWGTTTRKDNVLYIHLLDAGTDTLSITNLPFKKVKSATLLANGAALPNVVLKKGQLMLSGLKSLEHDPNDTVIKINF